MQHGLIGGRDTNNGDQLRWKYLPKHLKQLTYSFIKVTNNVPLTRV